MVNLVYFGADLSKEFDDPLPCFCAEPAPHWIRLQDLAQLLNAGETVTIRPATFAEFLQVESNVALGKIAADVRAQIDEAAAGRTA